MGRGRRVPFAKYCEIGWYAAARGSAVATTWGMVMLDLDLGVSIPQMYQDLIVYLGDHPAVLGGIGVFLLLAAIGAWYVISHHLHVLLVTMLCLAGFASGALVLYRGYQSGMRDLMAVGVFLLVIFPIIYQQLIKVAKIAYGDRGQAMAKGHAKRAGA